MSVGLIIPLIAGSAIMLFVNTDKLVVFIPLVLGYTIVYFISMWLFAMNSEEKQMIRSFAGKFGIKRKSRG